MPGKLRTVQVFDHSFTSTVSNPTPADRTTLNFVFARNIPARDASPGCGR
jgi:hypothetical protein